MNIDIIIATIIVLVKSKFKNMKVKLNLPQVCKSVILKISKGILKFCPILFQSLNDTLKLMI